MSISSPRDSNRVPAMMVTLVSDGTTPVNVKVDPTTHKVEVSMALDVAATSAENVQRDANRIPVMWGVSNADGVTPMAIYGTSDGKILVSLN